MPVDPSIYAQLGKGVTPLANPQDQLLKQMQTYGAFAQAQRLGMDLQGRRALAQAYQGVTIDPKTGIPDSNQLIQNLQNTPGGSLVLPQVIQGLQEQQARVFNLNKQSLEQTTGRTNAVNTALAPLMRMGANVTDGDVLRTLSGLHASGFPTDEFVNDAAATLPARQPGMSDAQYGGQLQSWIVNHAARAWPAAVQAEQFTPKVSYQNVGGQLVPVDMNANTNPGLAGSGPLGLGLTPEQKVAQVKGPMGPNGQQTVIPQSQYAQQNGMGNLVQGGGSGQASPFANGGRLPPALLNPNRPGGAPPVAGAASPVAAPVPGSIGAGSPGYAPAAAAPSGASTVPPPPPAYQPPPVSAGQAPPAQGAPMVIGMGPGQAAGATAAGDASAKQWAGLQSSVGGSAGRLYQLHSALGDLQTAGPTGPSSGTINNVKSYLLSLPVVGQSLGIDPNQVASYDMANKYLTAYAAARAGRFGGTTDSQLATTLSSNASTHISNLAAQDVVKANIGLERMEQAQIAGFQNGLDPATGQSAGQKFTPDQFSDYASKWNTASDARAFVADHLTPQQFTTTLTSMSPSDQARFQRTFNNGIAQGFIDPPAWMQQASPAQPAPAGRSAPPATSPAVVPPVTTQASAAPPMTPDSSSLPPAVRLY